MLNLWLMVSSLSPQVMCQVAILARTRSLSGMFLGRCHCPIRFMQKHIHAPVLDATPLSPHLWLSQMGTTSLSSPPSIHLDWITTSDLNHTVSLGFPSGANSAQMEKYSPLAPLTVVSIFTVSDLPSY
uniref:Uncharacterized protein n=1 Tax=Opuntia streptacantha TaxID=393608 RepID=A0A7C9A530_OPUST